MLKPTKLIPVYKEVLDDLNNPVSAFLKLNQKNSFLLESVTGGENVARYSFIGFDPICIFRAEKEKIDFTCNGQEIKIDDANPIDKLQEIFNSFSLENDSALPPFIGGAVGYFSWETIGYIEKINFAKKHGTDFPLAHFIFPGSLLIFDHAKRNISIVVLAEDAKQKKSLEKIEAIKEILKRPLEYPIYDMQKPDIETLFNKVTANYEKENFKHDVEKVKQCIYEGDIFQLVLSQKFSINSPKSPFDVYRNLRSINPSPYMFYFNFEDYQIIGSSPEILTRLENRKAVVRPIAGTRPRVQEKEEELIKELLDDAKEKAEHIMLVDLGRNDLGRVCKYNTIKTSDLMDIEKYSHVIHIVSNVEGELEKGKNAFDLFKATFPAGTLSGAPKVRAIEIIEALEPDMRGPYGGALGYIDFRGNMDLCIIIRTILAKNGEYHIQAGAGIVADSDPELEYQESRNKAKGMVEACF